ncbi:hypothetical protein L7F22_033513 [Adiantum nelumboides]|nr:hypothetical protein [Adiantum nelumboides]
MEAASGRKRMYIRTYCPSWKLLYPWSYLVFDEDGRERVKCSVCTEMKLKGPYAELGSTVIQKPALALHHNSEPHKRAQRRKNFVEGMTRPIEKHIELMVDSERGRIITVMQVMFHIVKEDMSFESFERNCSFHMYMHTPNMPISSEYSAYTNPTSGKEFLSAIYSVYWEKLKQNIMDSPYYVILVDESIDRRYEKHLIVYISFLLQGGKGPCVTKFVKLVEVKDGKAKSMHDSLLGVLKELGLPLHNMTAMGFDGAAAMLGRKTGLISLLKKDVPHVMGIHCIAHREALVVKDACECFGEFKQVDQFANKVREWVGDSCIQRQELKKLMDDFFPKHYEILRIHGVRWLSRGKLMQRLVKVMPILLECWKVKYPAMYKRATLFELQFIIHFLADVLKEVNVLCVKFQHEHVDITGIGREIDILLSLLQSRYLSGAFAQGSKCLSKFLKDSQRGVFSHVDKEGKAYHHVLSYTSILDGSKTITIEDCSSLAKAFTQKLVSNFDDRYQDHHLFNAAKLFSPKTYPKDPEIRGHMARQYLEQLASRYGALVDKEKCEGELQRFVLELMEAYPSLAPTHVSEVDWDITFDVWKEMKARRPQALS